MTQTTFSVTIKEDLLDESNETVALTLGTPTNATPGTSSALLTITDDDAHPPVVGFQSSTYSVTEGRCHLVAITVTWMPLRAWW